MADDPVLDALSTAAIAVLGLFPSVAVVWSVLTHSKTVATLAQLGALQGREMAQEQYEEATSSVSKAAQRQVRMQDQASFTLGVLNVAFTAYLVGAVPRFFYLWHTPKAVILIALRWHTFRQEGKHYLLYDFCYWANWLGLAYVWFFPGSARLFQVFFLLANGPLAWSVLAFSQSLIFHSHAHMTSVFVHVSPMLLTFCLRWTEASPTGPAFGPNFITCTSACESVQARRMLAPGDTELMSLTGAFDPIAQGFTEGAQWSGPVLSILPLAQTGF